MFPNKNAADISHSFAPDVKSLVVGPGAEKRFFWLSVALVVLVAFLGTTMLFFEKIKIKVLIKLYGLGFISSDYKVISFGNSNRVLSLTFGWRSHMALNINYY